MKSLYFFPDNSKRFKEYSGQISNTYFGKSIILMTLIMCNFLLRIWEIILSRYVSAISLACLLLPCGRPDILSAVAVPIYQLTRKPIHSAGLSLFNSFGWDFLLWLLSLPIVIDKNLQELQLNGLVGWLYFMWRARLSGFLRWWLHALHWNEDSPSAMS